MTESANIKFWLYKPKYSAIYEAYTEEEKEEIMNREGGVICIFDHMPSSEEIAKQDFAYYHPVWPE